MSPINKNVDHDVNRGVELMLRRREKTVPEELPLQRFNFGKVFSLFQREIRFNFELSVIRKT